MNLKTTLVALSCALFPLLTNAQIFTFKIDACEGHFDDRAEGSDPGGFAEEVPSPTVERLTTKTAVQLNEYYSYDYLPQANTDYVIQLDTILLVEQQGEARMDGLLYTMSRTRFRVICTVHCNNTGTSYPLRFEQVFEDRIDRYCNANGRVVSERLYQPSNNEILNSMADSMSKHLYRTLRKHKQTHKPHVARRLQRKSERMLEKRG